MKQTNIGGQAIMEGVMMRGKTVYAMAVRSPKGDIVIESDTWTGLIKGKLFRLPIFRGMAAFLESLVMGYRILTRSADIATEGMLEDEEEEGWFDRFLREKLGDRLGDVILYISIGLSLLLGVSLFFLLPVWLGSFFKGIVPTWALGIVEGLVRIGIFLLYIFAISRMKEIQRVFQYHGAEHKTINCFEAELPLTVENVGKCSRLHNRCGTSFLLIVMIISMVVFFFIRTDVILLRMASRILLVPFIAGISYEVIKWAGNSSSPLVKWVSYPGLCLQRLTTQEPDAFQMETAIAAMEEVLKHEGE